MWISKKQYKFLKENAEKNINAECEILSIKHEQTKSVARAMEEYSSVLQERDELRSEVSELENRLKSIHDLIFESTHANRKDIDEYMMISDAQECDKIDTIKRITKREGKHTVRIGNEWRRHDPVWDKLAYYEDLEEQGKLHILNNTEEYPCTNCTTGWGSISTEGCKSCHDDCKKLKQYNDNVLQPNIEGSVTLT